MPTQTIVTSLLIVLCIASSRGQWGLENLGDRIRAQVQQSVAPLKNLRQRIDSDVRDSWSPLPDNWKPLPDNWKPLPDNWNAQLAGNLAPLENLGTQIEQQVNEGLKPVRIMESTFKVKFGTDGTTVATYSPGGRRLIIKESGLYECDGRVSDADGTCSVPLKKLRFAQKSDFCYSLSRTNVNGWYCLGSTSSISTSFVNGEFSCEGTDGSPILIIKDKDYRKLCDNVTAVVKYKYYTYFPLKDFGNGLDCSGNNPQVCTYSETTNDLGSSQIIRGSTVIINKK